MPKHYPTVEEKREHLRRSVEKNVAALGRKARFQPIANNTAAGSCPACERIACQTYTAKKVPLMPLDECPHPDQCFGFIRTILGP